MKVILFRSIGLTLTLTMLLAPLTASVSAAPIFRPVPPALDDPAPQPPVPLRPVVAYSTRNDVSPPLRSIPPQPLVREKPVEIPRLSLPGRGSSKTWPATGPVDTVVQNWPGAILMPSPIQNFDGLDNDDNGGRIMPPDTQGDVGPNHYVQWVNLVFGVWDKEGHLLYGPAAGNSLWSGFGGPCETTNDGDIITLYDPLADRWLMSQFALPNYPYGPFYQCIAISQTPDPLGAWYRYEFLTSNTLMNDYPKFGVWPDGYYMTINQFSMPPSAWAGTGAFAFERDKMLSGQPAQVVYFDLGPSDWGGMLPSDLDGHTPPPADAPNYFVEANADEWDDGLNDELLIYEFDVDWITPGNSTFTQVATLPTAPFDGNLCGFSRDCIPQPGTSQRLDAIADRLMYRLQYRNFGEYETLVSNLTVDADGTDHAGVRWFELRKTGDAWAIHQQGTYAPDSDHRWMGSVAMDKVGNIALGYSVSSSSVYPSVRYAGRLAGDPLNTLPQAEVELAAGTTYHNGGNRWGDYSMMSVDPVDDCTFWYTQEYIASSATAWGNWDTRIGSFQFPGCIGATGTLSGTVKEVGSGNPITGARVEAESNSTFVTYSGAPDGDYRFAAIPVDVYTVTAEAYGYLPQTFTGVHVFSGTTTIQDLALTPASLYWVEGAVTDAATGWPLYASVEIAGYPGGTIWNDPVTGYYSVTLAEGLTYTFHVEAWVDGYNPTSRAVGPLTGDQTEDFDLDADAAACIAPGYESNVDGIHETFDATPPGWTVIDNAVTGAVWRFDDPGGRGNLTGGAGNFGIVDSDYEGYVDINTELRTPTMDLSSLTSVTLEFKYDFYAYSGSEVADVDVSANGAAGPWINVWTRSGDSDWGPQTAVIDISAIAGGQSNVMGRFHYYNANYDWWWQVDDVMIGEISCNPWPGGLVVGNVYDDNTGDPLIGAKVANANGFLATTASTPDDPAVDDGFYTIFSPPDSRPFTATKRGYAPNVDTVTVVQSDTVQHDFNLAAASLSYTPASLEITLDMGLSATLPFTLTNDGGVAATFEWIELDQGTSPLGPFEQPNYGVKPFKQHYLTTERLPIPAPPPAASYAAGDVIKSWPAASSNPWGIAYTIDDTVWIGEGWGNDTIYEYLPNGTPTGLSYPYSWSPVLGPADDAFDWNTRLLWTLDVGGDNCIHEMDPASGYTGNTICPGFVTSQRGLAYDPSSDTYFAGSWNDLMIHHFAADGTMLDEVNVGLAIAGLAYNPDTKHLFVMVNDTPNPVYVLDAADNYTITGQFTVTGFSDYGGAGLEMDCDGNLWAVDQDTQTVYQFESGESTTMCTRDVDWLSQDPITGTVASMMNQVIDVTFDAGQVDQPGLYQAQLKIKHDTPYNVTNVPVTMTVVHAPICGFISSSPDALGQTTYFTNTTTGVTPLTYRWDFDDSTISAAEHPTHTYAHAGLYTVVLTTTNVYGEDVCTGTVEVIESFHGVMLAPSTDATSGQPGATVTYTLQVTNTGNTVDTLTIASSGNDWTTEVVSTVGPLAPGEGTDVAVVVHIPAGANEGDSDTVTITATSQGDPAESDSSHLTTTAAGACVSVSGADFTFAPAALIGQTFIFTGAVTAGTPPITYTWDLNNGSAAQGGNPIAHTFPLTVTAQTYTVTMTAANSCPSQDTASKAVTVYLHYILFPIMRNYSP